jgi:hypothetical protein
VSAPTTKSRRFSFAVVGRFAGLSGAPGELAKFVPSFTLRPRHQIEVAAGVMAAFVHERFVGTVWHPKQLLAIS